MKELAERLAKAMPERFKYFPADPGTPWVLWKTCPQGYDKAFFETSLVERWWSLIGPLMDELEVSVERCTCGGDRLKCPTWLETCFKAVVEAAEARK